MMGDHLIVDIVTFHHHYITHYDVFLLLFIFCSTCKFICFANRNTYFPESVLSVSNSFIRVSSDSYAS